MPSWSLRHLLTAITFAALVATGCSDSDPASPDSAVADSAVDSSADAATDSRSGDGAPGADGLPAEAGADGSAGDGGAGGDGGGAGDGGAAGDAAADAAAGDAGVDGAAGDIGPDGPVGDGPVPILSGTITRSVAPALDGRGTIVVGLYLQGLPPPGFQIASVTVPADLAKAGSSATYAFLPGVPAGNYDLWAWLDDNSNNNPLFSSPDDGDMVVGPVPVTIGSTRQTKDIVLNKVQGFTGATPTGLRGTLRTTASLVHDGKGAIFVSLHTQPPPAGEVASVLIGEVDLSSPFNRAQYLITQVPPGNYYLRVFLDDNANVSIFAPGPDKGDLIHSQAIQVRVENNKLNVRDVLLDKAF